MLQVFFDGYDITEYLSVLSDFQRNLGAEREVKLAKTGDGVKGKEYLTTSYNENTIPMPFILRYDLISKRRALAGILNVKEPKSLFSWMNQTNIIGLYLQGTQKYPKNLLSVRGQLTGLSPMVFPTHQQLSLLMQK